MIGYPVEFPVVAPNPHSKPFRKGIVFAVGHETFPINTFAGYLMEDMFILIIAPQKKNHQGGICGVPNTKVVSMLLLFWPYAARSNRERTACTLLGGRDVAVIVDGSHVVGNDQFKYREQISELPNDETAQIPATAND